MKRFRVTALTAVLLASSTLAVTHSRPAHAASVYRPVYSGCSFRSAIWPYVQQVADLIAEDQSISTADVNQRFDVWNTKTSSIWVDNGEPHKGKQLIHVLAGIWGTLSVVTGLAPGDTYYSDGHQSEVNDMAQAWIIVTSITCQPSAQTYSSNLGVRAYVSPQVMRYNAYPVLVAHSHPGALCTASVRYNDTNRPPRSFSGYQQTMQRTVSWRWHEETKGSGGQAQVVCTWNGRQGSAVAYFSVSH